MAPHLATAERLETIRREKPIEEKIGILSIHILWSHFEVDSPHKQHCLRINLDAQAALPRHLHQSVNTQATKIKYGAVTQPLTPP